MKRVLSLCELLHPVWERIDWVGAPSGSFEMVGTSAQPRCPAHFHLVLDDTQTGTFDSTIFLDTSKMIEMVVTIQVHMPTSV